MSIDSLTILTRRKQRKHLADEEHHHHNTCVEPSDRIQVRLHTTDREQANTDAKRSPRPAVSAHDSVQTIATTSVQTKSYNTSAHPAQVCSSLSLHVYTLFVRSVTSHDARRD